jgi:hypothetical protein
LLHGCHCLKGEILTALLQNPLENLVNAERGDDQARQILDGWFKKNQHSTRLPDTPANRMNQPHSQAITFSCNLGIQAGQDTSHFGYGSNRNQLDSILKGDGLHFLPRDQLQALPDHLGNHNLGLG